MTVYRLLFCLCSISKQTRFKKKRTLFNKTRQYNIHILNKIFFFKYRTRQLKTTETNKLITYLNWNSILTKINSIIYRMVSEFSNMLPYGK